MVLLCFLVSNNNNNNKNSVKNFTVPLIVPILFSLIHVNWSSIITVLYTSGLVHNKIIILYTLYNRLITPKEFSEPLFYIVWHLTSKSVVDYSYTMWRSFSTVVDLVHVSSGNISSSIFRIDYTLSSCISLLKNDIKTFLLSQRLTQSLVPSFFTNCFLYYLGQPLDDLNFMNTLKVH